MNPIRKCRIHMLSISICHPMSFVDILSTTVWNAIFLTRDPLPRGPRAFWLSAFPPLPFNVVITQSTKFWRLSGPLWRSYRSSGYNNNLCTNLLQSLVLTWTYILMISTRLRRFLRYFEIPIPRMVFHECFFGYLWIHFSWSDFQSFQRHITGSDSNPRIRMEPFFIFKSTELTESVLHQSPPAKIPQ